MNRLRGDLFGPLRRMVQAIQEELHLLEQDLGLCAECGAVPPAPLASRKPSAPRRRVQPELQQRRVA